MSGKLSTRPEQAGLWVQRILDGDRLAISRAISAIEQTDRQHSKGVQDLLAGLYAHTGQAHLIGITGAPGTGKSTLVNQLALSLRANARRVGILAVDPSSPFTGGALLGDRIRMRDLATDPGVFVRSIATRGMAGGLGRAVYGAAQILDAAGYNAILVETVGAGQDEVAISALAHSVVVVEAPGLGDEIQAIKAGLFEIADILVVNKADHDGAARAVYALRSMVGQCSGQGTADTWTTPVLQTIALDGTGVPELAACLADHLAYLKRSGALGCKEMQRARGELEWAVRERLYARFQSGLAEGRFDEIAGQIADRTLTVDQALEALGID